MTIQMKEAARRFSLEISEKFGFYDEVLAKIDQLKTAVKQQKIPVFLSDLATLYDQKSEYDQLKPILEPLKEAADVILQACEDITTAGYQDLELDELQTLLLLQKSHPITIADYAQIMLDRVREDFTQKSVLSEKLIAQLEDDARQVNRQELIDVMADYGRSLAALTAVEHIMAQYETIQQAGKSINIEVTPRGTESMEDEEPYDQKKRPTAPLSGEFTETTIDKGRNKKKRALEAGKIIKHSVGDTLGQIQSRIIEIWGHEEAARFIHIVKNLQAAEVLEPDKHYTYAPDRRKTKINSVLNKAGYQYLLSQNIIPVGMVVFDGDVHMEPPASAELSLNTLGKITQQAFSLEADEDDLTQFYAQFLETNQTDPAPDVQEGEMIATGSKKKNKTEDSPKLSFATADLVLPAIEKNPQGNGFTYYSYEDMVVALLQHYEYPDTPENRFYVGHSIGFTKSHLSAQLRKLVVNPDRDSVAIAVKPLMEAPRVKPAMLGLYQEIAQNYANLSVNQFIAHVLNRFEARGRSLTDWVLQRDIPELAQLSPELTDLITNQDEDYLIFAIDFRRAKNGQLEFSQQGAAIMRQVFKWINEVPKNAAQLINLIKEARVYVEWQEKVGNKMTTDGNFFLLRFFLTDKLPISHGRPLFETLEDELEQLLGITNNPLTTVINNQFPFSISSVQTWLEKQLEYNDSPFDSSRTLRAVNEHKTTIEPLLNGRADHQLLGWNMFLLDQEQNSLGGYKLIASIYFEIKKILDAGANGHTLEHKKDKVSFFYIHLLEYLKRFYLMHNK